MENLDKIFNWISVTAGFVGGFLAGVLGGWDMLLKAVTVMTVFDYISGLAKAFYRKELSSETGFKGLIKKGMMFLLIGASCAVQGLLGENIPLREIVIAFFISNEGLSLLENAAVFMPVPQKLKDALIQIRDKPDGDR